MGTKTGIEWTDHTWNPWIGCLRVSPGCRQCYMYRDQERYGNDPKDVHRAAPATFNSPLKWKEPARVFTCSWSDFFIEHADPWRADAWDIIQRTPHLTYQILTKRPENIISRLPADWWLPNGYPNVWLGVSVEDQKNADKRIPLLLQVPAAVRFLSVEPLIGPVDLWSARYPLPEGGLGSAFNWGKGVNWVIAGGESGPEDKIRPASPSWFEALQAECHAADVPFFFKQMGGSRKINGHWGGNELYGKTYQEFPIGG